MAVGITGDERGEVVNNRECYLKAVVPKSPCVGGVRCAADGGNGSVVAAARLKDVASDGAQICGRNYLWPVTKNCRIYRKLMLLLGYRPGLLFF